MSRWLFFPSPAVLAEVIATCTGWTVQPFQPIRVANGLSAGPYGTGILEVYLRSDGYGAFFDFGNGTNATNFLSSNSSRDIVIDHDSGIYLWDTTAATMSVFATQYITLPLTGWSGTIPGATDAATISLG